MLPLLPYFSYSLFETNDKITEIAKIIKFPKAKGDIFISRSIFYDSNEYIIVGIDQKSFHLNNDIHTVEFSEDSNISLIDKEAFSGSSIKSISFPISVKQI